MFINITKAIACLEKAVHEMENRYKQLAEEGFNDMSDRIKAGGKGIERAQSFYISQHELLSVARIC